MLYRKFNISATNQDKFMKEMALCGEENRHCSECLKNSVNINTSNPFKSKLS
jgi:hypothetical protein